MSKTRQQIQEEVFRRLTGGDIELSTEDKALVDAFVDRSVRRIEAAQAAKAKMN
jgi:hypothetical protein